MTVYDKLIYKTKFPIKKEINRKKHKYHKNIVFLNPICTQMCT